MNVITNLVTKFVADTKKFDASINKSKGGVKKFAKSVTTDSVSITKALKGIGVGAAAASVALAAGFVGVIASINNTTIEIDKLVKTATKLNVPVAQLQKLHFMADLAGVSTQGLNMSLQRMTRRVSQAAMGTGEAQEALKMLNIDARELNALSPDEQFLKIASAMKKVANVNDQLALSQKIFDSEGVENVKIFRSEMTKVEKVFNSLGISLTGKMATNVEKYRDSISTLTTMWKGFKMVLSASVAPALQEITDRIIKFVQESGGVRPVALAFAGSIIDILSGLVKVFSFVSKSIDFLVTKMQKFGGIVQDILDRFRIVGEAISAGTIDPGVISTRSSIQRERGASQDTSVTGKVVAAFEDIKKALGIGIKESFIEPIKLAGDASKKYADQINLASFKLGDMISGVLKQNTQTELNRLFGTSDAQQKEKYQSAEFDKAAKDAFNILTKSGVSGKLSKAQDTQISKLFETMQNAIAVGRGGTQVGNALAGGGTFNVLGQAGGKNVTGLVGVLKELQGLRQKQLGQKVDVNVKVDASPDFITKIFTKQVASNAINKAIEEKTEQESQTIGGGSPI